MGFYCNPQFTLSRLLLSVLEVLIVPYQGIQIHAIHLESFFTEKIFHITFLSHHTMTTLEYIIIPQ